MAYRQLLPVPKVRHDPTPHTTTTTTMPRPTQCLTAVHGTSCRQDDPEYDLVVSSFSLCEISEKRLRRKVILNLWAHTSDHLVGLISLCIYQYADLSSAPTVTSCQHCLTVPSLAVGIELTATDADAADRSSFNAGHRRIG